MKRLFMLRNPYNGVLADDAEGHTLYYSSKPLAKGDRDKFKANGCAYQVTYGPDHRRYVGNA